MDLKKDPDVAYHDVLNEFDLIWEGPEGGGSKALLRPRVS